MGLTNAERRNSVKGQYQKLHCQSTQIRGMRVSRQLGTEIAQLPVGA
jgi:hypothetical protein